MGGFFANESATVTMSDGKDLVLKDLVIGCTTWHEGTDSFEEFDGLLALSFDMQSFLAPALFRFGPRYNILSFVTSSKSKLEGLGLSAISKILSPKSFKKIVIISDLPSL